MELDILGSAESFTLTVTRLSGGKFQSDLPVPAQTPLLAPDFPHRLGGNLQHADPPFPPSACCALTATTWPLA